MWGLQPIAMRWPARTARVHTVAVCLLAWAAAGLLQAEAVPGAGAVPVAEGLPTVEARPGAAPGALDSLAPCDSLLTPLRPLRADLDGFATRRNADDAALRLLRLSRRAQACVLEHTPSSAGLPWLPFVGEMIALRTLGRAEAAHANFAEFFAQHAQRFSTRLQAAAHIRQGWMHLDQNDYLSTSNSYLRALDVQTDWNVRERANVLIQTARALKQILGTDEERRYLPAYYKEARRLLQSAPPSLKATAAWQSEWALVLTSSSYHVDPADALAFSQRALDALTPAVNLRTRSVVHEGHQFHLISQGRLEEARSFLGRVRAALQQDTEPEANVAARIAVLEGRLAFGEKRFSDAAARFQEALAAYDEGEYPARQAVVASFLLGRAYEQQGTWDAAESAYQRSLSLSHSIREGQRGSNWAVLGNRQWTGIHRGLARVHRAQGHSEEALRTLDAMRSLLLSDLRYQSQTTGQMDAAARVQFDSLTSALQHVRTLLARDTLSARQRRTLEERDLMLSTERRRLVDFSATPPSLSLPDLHEYLRTHNRTLVAYVLGPAKDESDAPKGSYAFVVTSDTLHTVSLPQASADSVEADIRAVSPLFATPDRAATLRSTRFNLDALHRLYQRVVAPLRMHLPEDTRLTIVPDGALFRIPFSILVPDLASAADAEHDPASRSGSRATYLTEHYPITTALAPSLVIDSLTTAPVSHEQYPRDLVALGLSEFGDAPSRTQPNPLLALRTSRDSLTALPNVATELKAVASVLPNATVHHNQRATEAALRNAGATKILHIASHSITSAQSPLYNAIVLAPDAAAAGHPSGDGMLYLHEIQSRAQQIPLVALSGCRTAYGSLRSGQTMESLQYAFRATGAQATLASLWPTDDRASVALTRQFYHYLQEGHPKDVALQNAQQAYRTAHPNAGPFFWAAMTLYGSPQPLPLASPLYSHPLAWLLGLGIVCLALYAVHRTLRVA